MDVLVSRTPSISSELGLQRARGRVKAGFRSAADGTTRVAELLQEGCLKVRLPRPETEGGIDAVIINTSGGLTGGDAISLEIVIDEGARATVTTPACERIYRSIGGEVSIQQRVHVGSGARLDWIPQETILFDQARLRRRFDIELRGDAEVTLAEAVIFGRGAMGETVKSGFFCDFWRVRRDGLLLFADATRISDPFYEAIGGSATLGGNPALASVVHVGQDLEGKRDAFRAGLSRVQGSVAGASIIRDVLVTRIVAASSIALRRALILALESLRGPVPVPRLWSC